MSLARPHGRDQRRQRAPRKLWAHPHLSLTAAGGEDDIAVQLGVGAAAADAELDALKEAAEAGILAPGGLIGRFAPLVAAFCHNRCAARLAPSQADISG